MRSFAMDSIQSAEGTSKESKAVTKKELDGFVGQGYGIFAGSKVRWAKLRFSAERARWVSREMWHPQQRTSEEETGELLMELPFTDTRELLMDVLRHGHHVQVLEPEDLKIAVKGELERALSGYCVEL